MGVLERALAEAPEVKRDSSEDEVERGRSRKRRLWSRASDWRRRRRGPAKLDVRVSRAVAGGGGPVSD